MNVVLSLCRWPDPAEERLKHIVIMYFIETKATSRLPYLGHLSLNTYLSVVYIAAEGTELRGLKYIHLCTFVLNICFKSKSKLLIILFLLMVILAINSGLKTAS